MNGYQVFLMVVGGFVAAMTMMAAADGICSTRTRRLAYGFAFVCVLPGFLHIYINAVLS